MKEAGEPDLTESLRRRVADLEAFADQMRRGAAMTLAVLGIGATVLGLLVVWAHETIEETEHVYRLISLPFDLWRDSPEADDGEFLFAVGFSGLLLVQLGCLWLFAMVGGRTGTPRKAKVATVFVVLNAVGSLVPVIWWFAFPAEDRGPAVVPIVIGVALAILVVSAPVRGLWVLPGESGAGTAHGHNGAYD